MKLNTKSLLYGTFVLTAANFIVRLLGFIYRIFLSRMIGPEGMGLFQLVFPLYMVSITVTASGIPIAVSRLVAERKAIGDERGIVRTVIISLCLITIVSICLSAFFVLNIDQITVNLLQDFRIRPALFIFFPCILITGLAAVFKGYFYGLRDIHPPAFAEIAEQIIRMILVSVILSCIPSLNEQTSAAIAVFGMVMGELAGLLYLHYSYHQSVKNYSKSKETPSVVRISKTILGIALPITLTRLIGSSMGAANSILIPRRLAAGGMTSSEAIGTYGIISGMVMPLLFFPFALISALSVILIPNLSENVILKNWSNIRDKISKSILITCLTAFPTMALLVPLAHPIGIVLYDQPDVGNLLTPLAFSTIFLCLDYSLGNILNGLGKQARAAVHSTIGDVIQIICTYFLVAHPSFGIYGFIIGFIANSILVSVLNFITVVQVTRLKPQFSNWFIKPGLASLLMALVVRLLYLVLTNYKIAYGLSLIIAITIGLMVLFITFVLLGSIPYSFLNKLLRIFSPPLHNDIDA
ncbi:stage V sporulation protein B [Petroclostridium xylanilyticum]|uniref:stage V sporulation protein B n=1 Tax=Petroclostridium xylanilyticum TaxID=1792311 RepID=UPI0012FFC7BC|nr:stage V sporulation protein B [Petroclostridium xylanilyticum]